MLDLETLSRIQWAITMIYHFIFVPLTLGLILIMFILEVIHVKTNDDRYRQLSDYFGNLFVLNYAFGIVTGIGMTFQFGTNWANYSAFMGDVFGAPLAFEALLAFFLESTFTGIYIFKRSKISPKFRMWTVFLILLGTSVSALWIITANGFMQHPVGYAISPDGSHIILTDFVAVLLNPYAWLMLLHNNIACFLLGGIVVLSISAYKLSDKNLPEEKRMIFALCTKIAAWMTLVLGLLMPLVGTYYMNYITSVQPEKIDAIGGIVTGQPNQVPEALVPVVHLSFMIMVGLGTFFIIMSIYTIIFFKRYLSSPTLQKMYVWMWPLPYIAITAGWIVSECGRQPWVVYGLMPTSEGVSQVPISQVWFSLITITILNLFLLAVGAYLTMLQLKKSPDEIKYEYTK